MGQTGKPQKAIDTCKQRIALDRSSQRRKRFVEFTARLGGLLITDAPIDFLRVSRIAGNVSRGNGNVPLCNCSANCYGDSMKRCKPFGGRGAEGGRNSWKCAAKRTLDSRKEEEQWDRNVRRNDPRSDSTLFS